MLRQVLRSHHRSCSTPMITMMMDLLPTTEPTLHSLPHHLWCSGLVLDHHPSVSPLRKSRMVASAPLSTTWPSSGQQRTPFVGISPRSPADGSQRTCRGRPRGRAVPGTAPALGTVAPTPPRERPRRSRGRSSSAPALPSTSKACPPACGRTGGAGAWTRRTAPCAFWDRRSSAHDVACTARARRSAGSIIWDGGCGSGRSSLLHWW
mmetsp:Transcript_5667/g.16792  ORF Transcript_5667/g.16792 Transcript_5667/m.16792 type:complete len:207 (+) Transcript_5667:650-1270(+)